MSIKQIVNNHDLWQALLKEFDDLLEMERNSLERAVDLNKMYQHQGAISILRRLKKLRENVNGRK